MGWKTVKEHYRVNHHVQVTKKGICIGSGYIPDLIVISLEGALIKRYEDRSNDDLRRYQAEMDADPAKLRELVLAADTFDAAVPVFTYDGGRIVEQLCEVFGWPNATHDGSMVYENTHFLDRADAIARAKSDAASTVRGLEGLVQRAEDELAQLREGVARARADLAQLENDYPHSTVQTS